MKCLYCDESYHTSSSIVHYLFTKDKLCEKCRRQLVFKRKYLYIHELKVESFYIYNEMFSSLILQFKECHDEALKDVFISEIKEYLRIKYCGYTIVYVPSSISNLKRRGFNHLELMFKELKLKKLDILEKVNDISQNNLSFKERAKMVNNIRLKSKGYILPSKVLLVDDVYTSGSSIYGSYIALKPYIKDIKAITVSYIKGDML